MNFEHFLLLLEVENVARKHFNDGIWIKYKEGFINAVRYNVKMNKLL